MPLEKVCTTLVNHAIFVFPVTGFGWSRSFLSEAAEKLETGIAPPSPFWMKLLKAHEHEGKIRALTGVIVSNGHPLQGMFVGLVVRDGGGEDFYNLTAKPTLHNVHIGNAEPLIKIQSWRAVPLVNWIEFEGTESQVGMGYVAENPEYLRIALRHKPGLVEMLPFCD